jgi:trans-2,3-dihydro-3-hydroxyanthranilate isomerase
MKKNLCFALYDVFCDRPFSGNPAAVVRSEGPLTPERLLTLAKEFNLPETCAYWIADGIPHMIFATSDKIIDACGHGLLAVLADVARMGVLTTSEGLRYVVETCGPGLWKFKDNGPRSVSISAKWPKLPTLFKELPPDETARLLGINVKRIHKNLPLKAFNSGIVNGLVPLVDEQTLTNLRPDLGKNVENYERYKSYFEKYKLDDLELYCITKEQVTDSNQVTIRTRNVFPYGVWEEAATGSASLSLAAALFEHFQCSDLHVNVTQGLSRRGKITARIVTEAETTAAWLEGRVELIASGSDLVVPA